jgi:hypothetical protein
MRRLASLLALPLAMGLAFGADVANPTAMPSKEAIQSLVDQLGSEIYGDRESASVKLEKIGLPALDALRVATRSENPEIRDRAIAIAGKIQRFVDSNGRLTPKRVKLSYRNELLGTAFNDLKTKTGLNIILDPNRVANPMKRVTCETKELPVWEALEAFCEAAELREVFTPDLDMPKQASRRGYVPPPPAPNADAVPVIMGDGKRERLPGDRSTLVRVLALPSSFPGHRVTLGTGEINFCFDITPAPATAWQDVTAVKISRLVDSAGRLGSAGLEKSQPASFDPTGAIMFARPGVAFRMDNMGNTILPDTMPNPRIVMVPLRINTPHAKYLKRLEGTVLGELNVLNQELIVINDPKQNTNTAFSGSGDIRFTVLEAMEAAEMKKGTGPGWGTIRVQLEYPAPWVANARRRGLWNPGWPEAPQNPKQGYRVDAFDAAGNKVQLSPLQSTMDSNDDGTVMIQTLQYRINSDRKLPAKLVVVGPRTVTAQVPFVMENVPLP